jgi:lipoprotein-anchoring transpeptidase ErfK/SrfK
MRVLGIVVALFIAGVVSPANAGIVARIDISSQKMNVYTDGKMAYSWKISTAGKGYRTPVGSYSPTRMHRMWYSRKYDNAPMPHSIFFRGGYAIHGTNHVKSLGRPASHGCVRLAPGNARILYNLVRGYGAKNTRIVLQH